MATRRAFLKTSALAGGTLAVAGPTALAARALEIQRAAKPRR
jgi:hypothetical protein